MRARQTLEFLSAGEQMRKLALITILGAVLVLQGCGFQLRGKVQLSPDLENVFVEGADPELVSDIKRSLDFSGARLASTAEAASSVLLIDSRYERQVRTLDSRGIATGYVLRYDVRFVVLGAEGERRHQSSVISLRRNLDFDATQVLQKEGEEEFLREDMRKQIVQRVMRQLSAI
jgi:LPS-assembly lipoprotein